MPRKPRFTQSQAEAAIANAESWKDVLDALGYGYSGKRIETVRKWAERWDIAMNHLSDRKSVV